MLNTVTTFTCKEDYIMSDLDIRALEANFELWRKDRAPRMKPFKAFEWYAVEQVLKDAELSDEEIKFGMLGGGDDGGVDSMYFFINKVLIQEETEIPEPAIEAELIIVQSKFETGFSETAVQKITSFMSDLLDYSKPIDSLTYLNPYAREAMSRFREVYDVILGQPHKLKVSFAYATKSVELPNPKVIQRVNNLKSLVNEKLSAAEVGFEFWGCKRLLSVARTTAKRILTLKTNKTLTTDDGSLVCFVTLREFADFLTNEQGGLRGFLLEPNVRAYQGNRNPVNTDIRKTLEATDSTEFWWLNNGITILASACPISGNTISMEKPEVVNGLQTSQEIFEYFRENLDKQDNRNLLIRVIVQTDEPTRNRIIKATNFQTPVNPLSLHATDAIHFDIQDRLKLYGLFYDRRKGYYKNLRKPIADIVSIIDVARVVIAILLQRPDDARARPQSLTKRENTYKEIFNESYNKDLYPACVLLDRQVNAYLKTKKELYIYERGDIRYYVGMLVASELTQTAHPTSTQIASLVPKLLAPIDESIMKAAYEKAYERYKKLGALPYVAKGVSYKLGLIRDLESRFPLTEIKYEKEY